MSTATYVALLTPPGRGALATIEVRGPDAWRCTQACLDRLIVAADVLVCQSQLANQSPVRPWLRSFRGDHGAQEELVVTFPAAEVARLHCHGGLAACENVLRALESQGAVRRAAWQDFADPWRVALAGALTERTALHLLDQSPAAWQHKFTELLKMLDHTNSVAALVGELDDLLARAPLGLHLTEPWRIVIAGRPNAGKSSLLNALLGFQRSIIHHEPGTTRDVVTARTAFDGWPVELRDTAGLRHTQDELEAAGVERAEEEIRTADLVLYVIPADLTVAEHEAEVAAADRLHAQGCELLVVRSKSDVQISPTSGTECSVSARTMDGIPALISAIVNRLIEEVPARGTLLPFHHELVARLQQARSALLVGDVAVTRRELQASLPPGGNIALPNEARYN